MSTENPLSSLLESDNQKPLSSGNWKEAEDNTIKRRQWEIDEAKHLVQIKKIQNKASTSYTLLQIIILIVVVAFIYGLISGDLFTVLASIFTLITGGSGTLFYRHKSKVLRQTTSVNPSIEQEKEEA